MDLADFKTVDEVGDDSQVRTDQNSTSSVVQENLKDDALSFVSDKVQDLVDPHVPIKMENIDMAEISISESNENFTSNCNGDSNSIHDTEPINSIATISLASLNNEPISDNLPRVDSSFPLKSNDTGSLASFDFSCLPSKETLSEILSNSQKTGIQIESVSECSSVSGDTSESQSTVDLSLVKQEPLDEDETPMDTSFMDNSDINIKEEMEDIKPDLSSIDAIKTEPNFKIKKESDKDSGYSTRFKFKANMYSREQVRAAIIISQSQVSKVVNMDMFTNVGNSMPVIRLKKLDYLVNNLDEIILEDVDIVKEFSQKYGRSFTEWKKSLKIRKKYPKLKTDKNSPVKAGKASPVKNKSKPNKDKGKPMKINQFGLFKNVKNKAKDKVKEKEPQIKKKPVKEKALKFKPGSKPAPKSQKEKHEKAEKAALKNKANAQRNKILNNASVNLNEILAKELQGMVGNVDSEMQKKIIETINSVVTKSLGLDSLDSAPPPPVKKKVKQNKKSKDDFKDIESMVEKFDKGESLEELLGGTTEAPKKPKESKPKSISRDHKKKVTKVTNKNAIKPCSVVLTDLIHSRRYGKYVRKSLKKLKKRSKMKTEELEKENVSENKSNLKVESLKQENEVSKSNEDPVPSKEDSKPESEDSESDSMKPYIIGSVAHVLASLVKGEDSKKDNKVAENKEKDLDKDKDKDKDRNSNSSTTKTKRHIPSKSSAMMPKISSELRVFKIPKKKSDISSKDQDHIPSLLSKKENLPDKNTSHSTYDNDDTYSSSKHKKSKKSRSPPRNDRSYKHGRDDYRSHEREREKINLARRDRDQRDKVLSHRDPREQIQFAKRDPRADMNRDSRDRRNEMNIWDNRNIRRDTRDPRTDPTMRDPRTESMIRDPRDPRADPMRDPRPDSMIRDPRDPRTIDPMIRDPRDPRAADPRVDPMVRDPRDPRADPLMRDPRVEPISRDPRDPRTNTRDPRAFRDPRNQMNVGGMPGPQGFVADFSQPPPPLVPPMPRSALPANPFASLPPNVMNSPNPQFPASPHIQMDARNSPVDRKIGPKDNVNSLGNDYVPSPNSSEGSADVLLKTLGEFSPQEDDDDVPPNLPKSKSTSASTKEGKDAATNDKKVATEEKDNSKEIIRKYDSLNKVDRFKLYDKLKKYYYVAKKKYNEEPGDILSCDAKRLLFQQFDKRRKEYYLVKSHRYEQKMQEYNAQKKVVKKSTNSVDKGYYSVGGSKYDYVPTSSKEDQRLKHLEKALEKESLKKIVKNVLVNLNLPVSKSDDSLKKSVKSEEAKPKKDSTSKYVPTSKPSTSSDSETVKKTDTTTPSEPIIPNIDFGLLKQIVSNISNPVLSVTANPPPPEVESESEEEEEDENAIFLASFGIDKEVAETVYPKKRKKKSATDSSKKYKAASSYDSSNSYHSLSYNTSSYSSANPSSQDIEEVTSLIPPPDPFALDPKNEEIKILNEVIVLGDENDTKENTNNSKLSENTRNSQNGSESPEHNANTSNKHIEEDLDGSEYEGYSSGSESDIDDDDLPIDIPMEDENEQSKGTKD